MYLTIRVSIAAAVIALVAAFLPLPWVFLVLGDLLLAALIATDIRRAPRARHLQLARDAPGVLSLERSGQVGVRMHNPTSRPLRVTVRDASLPSLGRMPVDHRLTLSPGGWATGRAEVRPSRRGWSPLGPMTVRTGGPLGLAGRQATLPLTDRVKVYPALPSRAEVELRLDRARLLQSGERSTSIRGGGTDFDSLREYHPDDEFRRINWRATARSTKPISNVYREERNQQVVLLLDAGRTMAAMVAGVSRFEHAIDAAYAVAELASRVGDHVGMVAFATEVLAMLGPGGGRSQPRILLDLLFDLQPRLDAANYRGAFTSLLSRHRRRSLLVLLTELTDEAAMESLFAALPAILGRHLVIVAALVDPEIESAALAVPGSSEEAYLKAAAAESISSRERAAARLRRMGVVVVDRPPGRLAGELADQYLRIKAFGRL
jgi:uncharacterized protein (DUF58 family)